MTENTLATQSDYAPERLALIRRTVCGSVDLTDDEFALFVEYAKRTGLDPIRRHLHAVKRKGVMTIQTGIDGYRLIARRDGLAGIDDATFIEHEGQKFPEMATVTVYRWSDKGEREAYTASARWSEYHPGGNQAFMWTKMPHTMLAKCAEALALRKGFQECAGLYVDEEMDQADATNPPATISTAPTDQRVVREPPAPEAKTKASPIDNLRRGTMASCKNLIAADEFWGSLAKSQGEPEAIGAMRDAAEVGGDGALGADDMRKLKEWADERLTALGPEHDPETGETSPEPYEPSDGQGDLLPPDGEDARQ